MTVNGLGNQRGGVVETWSCCPSKQQFLAALSRKDTPPAVAALSVPRGNGKSWLCGGLVARAADTGRPAVRAGQSRISWLVRATNQARIVLEFARAVLGEVGGVQVACNDGVTNI